MSGPVRSCRNAPIDPDLNSSANVGQIVFESIDSDPHFSEGDDKDFVDPKSLNEEILNEYRKRNYADETDFFEDVTYQAEWTIASEVSDDPDLYWTSGRVASEGFDMFAMQLKCDKGIAFIAVKAYEKGTYCPKDVIMKLSTDENVQKKTLENKIGWQFIVCDFHTDKATTVTLELRDTQARDAANPNRLCKLRQLRVFAHDYEKKNTVKKVAVRAEKKAASTEDPEDRDTKKKRVFL